MATIATAAPKPGARVPAGPFVPFARAAHQVVEGPFLDRTVTPGSAEQAIGPVDVPARGYMRHLVLLVTGSGGALGGATLSADFPFNVFREVSLQDPNGTNYYGPLSGYSAFVSNLYGGYAFESDPTAAPEYNGSYATPAFIVRVPVEITAHDGYGSLVNQNAAASFKLFLRLAPNSDLVSGGSPTAPTLRIRAYLEAWTQPLAQAGGRDQETEPPGHPTAQYWSSFTEDVAAGSQTIRLQRVGNLYRVLILVFRNTSGARVEQLPDPIRITWDARDLYNESLVYRRRLMYERYGRANPTGVVVYDWISDGEGHAGDELRNSYLPTESGTRLEVVGNFGAAGTLEIITNDIAPAGAPVRP